MAENRTQIYHDGSSYNRVWKDTVCGTGRFEARQGYIGQGHIRGYRGEGDGSIVIIKRVGTQEMI